MEESEPGTWLRQLAGGPGIVIVLCYILHCHIVSLSPDHREVVTRKLTDMYWHNPDSRHTSSGRAGTSHQEDHDIFLSLPLEVELNLLYHCEMPLWDIKYSRSFQHPESLYHIFSHNKMPPGHPPISNHTRQRADQTLILTLIPRPTTKVILDKLYSQRVTLHNWFSDGEMYFWSVTNTRTWVQLYKLAFIKKIYDLSWYFFSSAFHTIRRFPLKFQLSREFRCPKRLSINRNAHNFLKFKILSSQAI